MVTPIMMYAPYHVCSVYRDYDIRVCLHYSYVQYVVINKGIKQQHTWTKSLHRGQRWPL